jgi:hypothetical protein
VIKQCLETTRRVGVERVYKNRSAEHFPALLIATENDVGIVATFLAQAEGRCGSWSPAYATAYWRLSRC